MVQVFTKPVALPPAKLGRLTITITTQLAADGSVNIPTGTFELDRVDVNQKYVDTMAGDLAPQLTQAQIDGVITLMTQLRTKGNTEAI